MKQKLYYDKHAKDLSILTPGATVRIRQGDRTRLIAILDNFTIQRSRKYFIETKPFIKISFVLQNLFRSVREKTKS